MDVNQSVTALLCTAASEKTAAFSAKLVPTVAPSRFLGVKSADIRAAAKALLAGELPVTAAEFRATTPHSYVELDMVHMHTLNAIRDAGEWRAACEDFLPFIDNWMVTDALDPVLLRGKRAVGSEAASAVIAAGREWLASAVSDGVADTYRVRAGVLVFLQALQKGHFAPEHLCRVAAVRHTDYYVHMAVGWYFATAFDKYELAARPFLEENGLLQLDAHRIAVRKIIESRRTSAANLAWARAKRTELKQLAKMSR